MLRAGSQSPRTHTGVPSARVPTGAPLSAQEVLENLKDRWYQADNPPPDLLLTEEEFLSFLHPEHSRGMLRFMVKEIVRDLGEAWLQPARAPAPPAGGSLVLLAGGRCEWALGWAASGACGPSLVSSSPARRSCLTLV